MVSLSILKGKRRTPMVCVIRYIDNVYIEMYFSTLVVSIVYSVLLTFAGSSYKYQKKHWYEKFQAPHQKLLFDKIFFCTITRRKIPKF